jgi:hypothetical protein
MQFDQTKEKNLIVVNKEEVRTYWHLIEPALITMQAEKESADKWIVPEVYASIIGGGATLAFTSVAKEAGMTFKDRDTAIRNACGFVVLQQVKTYAATNMHIWISSRIDSDEPRVTGSIMRIFNHELNEMAKANSCTGITFNSNRDFWVDVAPRFGFEINDIRWIKPVK